MYKVLHRFGFHGEFVKIIEALYSKPTARIKINGTLSNSFDLERGCRQGCPVSPLLFAVFIEPLSQWIRQNENIHGIKMGQVEQKIALFADDILIYVGSPNVSLPNLINTLSDYGSISGYRLNTHKSQVLTFNYTPNQTIRDTFKIKWHSEVIKYLGVNIPKNTEKILSLNYDPLISKIKSDLSRWSLLPFLSIAQKVEAIKINILPRLLYLFQTIPAEIPARQFQELDKIISRFIWQGGKPRIRFRTLQLPKVKGGLSLPNLRNYYRAAQLKTLVDICNPSYIAKWKEIERQISSDIPLQAIIGDFSLDKHVKDCNPWIKTSLKIWFQITREHQTKEPFQLLKWITYDSDFLPNRMNNNNI